MTSPYTNISAKDWALLVLLSIIWGGSFFFTKVALADLTPFTLVALRLCTGCIFLLLILRLMGLNLPKDIKIWRAFAVMGFLNNMLPFSLIVWGQTHIESGLASILNATVPLFTILVAFIIGSDERPGLIKIIGVFFGFCGIIVMIGPDVLMGQNKDSLAQIACLSAALSYAFAGFYGKRFKAAGLKPMVTATGQVLVSALVMLFIALIIDNPIENLHLTKNSIFAVLCLGILSTALAYTLYFQLLARMGASNLMLVTFLIPVSAILLGVFILHERLSPSEIAGMTLIGFGLMLIDGRIFKRLRKNLRPQ